MRPAESKILAIQQIPPPQTKKDVRAFVGMAAYYRCFIWNFAAVAEPLTRLTRKDQLNDIQWTKEADKTFAVIKEALTTSTIMCNPDFTKPFTLQTDASMVGVGPVLSQGEKPIAYYRKKLSDCEQKCVTVQLECLAVIRE